MRRSHTRGRFAVLAVVVAALALAAGCSSDDQASHKKFAAEHKLPFSLVADEDGLWARSFGVSTTLGMDARVTFLIGPDGKIAHVYPDVDPGVHADRVLDDATGAGVQ